MKVFLNIFFFLKIRNLSLEITGRLSSERGIDYEDLCTTLTIQETDNEPYIPSTWTSKVLPIEEWPVNVIIIMF